MLGLIKTLVRLPHWAILCWMLSMTRYDARRRYIIDIGPGAGEHGGKVVARHV